MGIVIADDELRMYVRRRFHWPMIILALMILPLLAWEFLAKPTLWTFEWWMSALAMSIIWVAFFVEFVVKITIAESRFEYVKKNWLDLIVLALPLLRPLRVAYLARTSRVFALRGVGMKFARYVITILIGLEATERLLERVGVKSRKGRPRPEEMTRYQLMDEVNRLRRETDGWRSWHAGHQEFNEQQGLPCYGKALPPVKETAEESAAQEAASHRSAEVVGHDNPPPTIASACQSPSPN